MELKKTERIEVQLPVDMPNKYIDETGVQWTYARCFYCHMNCGIVIGADTKTDRVVEIRGNWCVARRFGTVNLLNWYCDSEQMVPSHS